MKIYLINGGYYNDVCCKNFESLAKLIRRSILKVTDCSLKEYDSFCDELENSFTIENNHTVKIADILPCHVAELQAATIREYETLR